MHLLSGATLSSPFLDPKGPNQEICVASRHRQEDAWALNTQHKQQGWSDIAWVQGKVRGGTVVGACRTPFQDGKDLTESRRVADYAGNVQVSTWKKVCEGGQLTEAVEALDLLVHHGSYVEDTIFYALLKRCIVHRDLILGSQVHALAVKIGYESNAFLANHIICMYASHGKLEEATRVFFRVPVPNSHMWASTILAHARHGQPKRSIELYRQMRKSTVKPNNHIFVAALRACAAAADLSAGREVHADILGSQDKPDMFVWNCLVDMYAKCGSIVDAHRVFDHLPTKDVVTWTAMISAYAQYGLGLEALTLYRHMEREGTIQANAVTFVCLLQACACIGDLHQGKQLHSRIRERGLEGDVVVGTGLVDMYVKCKSIEDARRVFDNLPRKNVLTWNAMVGGYVQHGLGKEALSLYGSMQQEGITQADAVTFICLLQACASTGVLRQGKQLHAQIQEQGLEADLVVGSSLVDLYATCGSVEDARKVFDRLPRRNVVTWNTMIGGYAKHGLGQEALALYGSMQLEGVTEANHVTYVCLLQACASVGALSQGKQLHAQIQDRGLEANVVVGSSLVGMYAKCGRLEDARRVFDGLPTRNVVTWTSLLLGYAQHSNGQLAMQCFEQMLQEGVEPDGTTFICLLMACSHAGLMHEGQQYFNMMVENGIAPSLNHYNCMVDLLGRSGCLSEAENVLRTMPFKGNVVGWRCLLSVCKSYGDVERGRICFDRLLELEPRNASAYVLMVGIYANAGRWKDADEIENMRKSIGAWKKAAKACIEVKNRVHMFTVGEERSDISPKLSSLTMRLKDEGGHVPQTELVLKALSNQEKEDALCGHAEKLALAYGLINTPAGTTLLVTKNLRMCNDCHTSTKIMSRIEKREIIVRDAHRVHHFLGGSCSCQDRH